MAGTVKTKKIERVGNTVKEEKYGSVVYTAVSYTHLDVYKRQKQVYKFKDRFNR